jgi:hypothetical protein
MVISGCNKSEIEWIYFLSHIFSVIFLFIGNQNLRLI